MARAFVGEILVTGLQCVQEGIAETIPVDDGDLV